MEKNEKAKVGLKKKKRNFLTKKAHNIQEKKTMTKKLCQLCNKPIIHPKSKYQLFCDDCVANHPSDKKVVLMSENIKKILVKKQ